MPPTLWTSIILSSQLSLPIRLGLSPWWHPATPWHWYPATPSSTEISSECHRLNHTSLHYCEWDTLTFVCCPFEERPAICCLCWYLFDSPPIGCWHGSGVWICAICTVLHYIWFVAMAGLIWIWGNHSGSALPQNIAIIFGCGIASTLWACIGTWFQPGMGAIMIWCPQPSSW